MCRHAGAHPDPPLLQVHGAPVGVLHQDVGLHRLLRHGQQPHPRPPPLAQRLGDRGQPVARPQHPGAHQVRGDVPVAEREPVRPRAVGRELLGHRRGLVAASPALLLVDGVAQGVHQGVQVGADPQPVQGDVVTGVGHDRDLVLLVGAGRGQVSQEPAQEPGSADAARQRGDSHAMAPRSRGDAVRGDIGMGGIVS